MEIDRSITYRNKTTKPQITYAGDRALFKQWEDEIVKDLPTAPVEWRRSYGRAPKTVKAVADFIELNVNQLCDDKEVTTLIGQTFLHTFWTDCFDVEIYKNQLKDDIAAWLTLLKSNNVKDWVIVLVEGADSKKGSKPKILTRGSVLDKIRNDFCKKQTDRCVSVTRNESSDSWQAFLHRLRFLLLQAYNRQLSRFEENMRSQRERRNEPGWNFCDYFLLQEELAFVFEMLGIYDEALVQYDELDAMFSQFVINSNLGDTPEWLLPFSGPCLCWEGLSFSSQVGEEKRILIQQGKATLLDLRNYLFARQCSLLLTLARPWELAQRFLTFMHGCINELQILEVEMPVGAVACWVFLSSLQVLQTCNQFKDSNEEEAYFTASLWAIARSKLQELGTLCGLMPQEKTTSEQLHHVVELVAGMGIDRNLGRTDSPLAKLKEALSSDEAFKKQYLELSELAIGTLKHIGRIRYARLIGRDLADFYRKLGAAHKSAGYLLDALKTFQEERWTLLSAHTLTQLAECYAATDDVNKLINVGLLMASSEGLKLTEREEHFDKVKEQIDQLSETGEKLCLNMTDMLSVVNATMDLPDNSSLTVDSTIRVKLTIKSYLPKSILCEAIILAISEDNNDPLKTRFKSNKSNELKRRFLQPLRLTQKFVYREDKSLDSSLIVETKVNNPQVDTILPLEGETVKSDFNQSLRALDVNLQPGNNEIVLEGKCELYGCFRLTQLIVRIGNLDLILPHINIKLKYELLLQPTTLTRVCNDYELIAGILQEIELKVCSGSTSIAPGTKIELKTSSGLLIKLADGEEDLTTKLEYEIDSLQPFESSTKKLTLFCNFAPQKDTSTIQSKIKAVCPWSENVIDFDLQFVPPFISLYKLHTMHSRKFIQIQIHSPNPSGFELKKPTLLSNNTQITPHSLNPPIDSYIVRVNQTVSFVWELVTNLVDYPGLNLELTIDYKYPKLTDDIERTYKHKFDLTNYKTLYMVNYKVEPRGSEFCRAGNMCNMSIKIVRNTPSGWSSIMYEVLADQTSWAVCGRTAGVVNMESSVQFNVVIDVMPLTSGYLPLPIVRLSKFIAANQLTDAKDSPKKIDGGFSRVEPFNQGQIYNASAGLQVFVIPAFSSANAE